VRLLFVTQAVDEDDNVLGFTVEWIRALSRFVEQVICVAVRIGRHSDLPSNVRLLSMGKERGRSSFWLALESQRLLASLARDVDAALAHMAPELALLCWPHAVVRRFPLFMWYTHEKVTLPLRLAVAASRTVFTAVPESLRLDTNKRLVMGHGVPVGRFGTVSPAASNEVLALGRVSPIKELEVVAEAARLLRDKGLRFRIVGSPGVPSDESYLERLKSKAREHELAHVLTFEPSIPYESVPAAFGRSLCGVSASSRNYDKVALECLAAGRLTLVANEAYLPLLGAEGRWLHFPAGDSGALAERIERIRTMPAQARSSLANLLRDRVRRDHSVDSLARRLVGEMTKFVT
jgi:glycosyltransferase involved in cell wall biosynthesis